MHESSIISYTLKSVEKAALQNNITYVDEIVLVIGKLRAALPAALQKVFHILRGNGMFSNTSLIIKETDIVAVCLECGVYSQLDLMKCDMCPACKSRKLKLLQGNELIIENFKGR